ncbi:hypothetical protein O9993_17710 [Vibrio lentus]|nr:hypothetical protein [Vibrio lentus]
MVEQYWNGQSLWSAWPITPNQSRKCLSERALFRRRFSGYAGLSKFWNNYRWLKAKCDISKQLRVLAEVGHFGNNEKLEQDRVLNSLFSTSIYHFKHSYFNQWNSSYVYMGATMQPKTTSGKVVPKNIAYEPTALLAAVDLGSPLVPIPQRFEAIPLMLSTSSPQPADYTIVRLLPRPH